MNKIVTLLLLTLICASLCTFAQRNYGQELFDLLSKGNYFEARDFKKQYADCMPQNRVDKGFLALYDQYKMASFLNQPDRAASCLHQILNDYESVLGLEKSHFYSELLNLYTKQQQFDKGIALCDEIMAYFQRNPFNIEAGSLQNSINDTEKIKTYFAECEKTTPRIRLLREKSQPIALCNDSAFIYFDALYNNHRVRTWFDTGVSYYFLMEKKVADGIGVKYKPSEDSLQLINGVNVRAVEGMIDSVFIGNIRMYNLPVMILLDQFATLVQDSLENIPENKKARIEEAFSSPSIFLGLPAMQLIGQFEFNWKSNTLVLPREHRSIRSEPNIYLEGIFMYTKIAIDEIDYTAMLDCGSLNFVDVDSLFYEKNKRNIRIDTISIKEPLGYVLLTHVFQNIQHEYLAPDVPEKFENKMVPCHPKEVIIYKTTGTGSPKGAFGVHFFRRLGSKTVLDFRTMRLEGRGKPNNKSL